VVSGVNHGGNLGQDAVISGTVAAAREAAYHGLRAAAFSHYMVRGLGLDWGRLSGWCGELLCALMSSSGQGLADGEFWNANFPHYPPGPLVMPEVASCVPARSPLGVSFESVAGGFLYNASYAERPQDAGSDVSCCFGGKVALTRLSVR
jgi:5'-nucleotidase